MPVEEVLNLMGPVFPKENDQWFKAYGTNYLAIPELLHAKGITKTLKRTITYTLEKKWEVFDYSISSLTPDQVKRSYGFMSQ